MKRYMVVGGAGFIGSAFVRRLVEDVPEAQVLIVDAFTYAADPQVKVAFKGDKNVCVVEESLTNTRRMRELMGSFCPDAVVNFAAETHVDNSIAAMQPFFETNVGGTVALLSAFKDYLSASVPANARYLQVSTDEVYGASSGATAPFSEAAPLQPRNPYAASKASADLAVLAAHTTYQLPVLIGRCSNNFGPRQSPEKLIPKVILKALRHEAIPVYGSGLQRRDWIYVDDHARALQHILNYAELGSVTNISAHHEVTNIELIGHLLQLLQNLTGDKNISTELIAHVADRPGHDVRYVLDTHTLEGMGWTSSWDFDTALRTTVQWYVDNISWLEDAQARLEEHVQEHVEG